MDDDFDAQDPRAQDDRPRGVPKAKLGDVDLEPKLSIFHRPDRNVAMTPLETSFPREAAKIFCDRIHARFRDHDGHAYVITGGSAAAYKKIFAWIKDCVQNQSIEKFPDVRFHLVTETHWFPLIIHSQIPEPETDPFTQTIDIIQAGEMLGVPAGSLSFHLKKRLNGCARKQLMPFRQVRDQYDVNSNYYNLGLREVACSSIFNAWWDARLDQFVNPELMEELFDMREEFRELDEDLHKACQAREEEIRKKWAEKMVKKNTELAGGSEWDATGAGPASAIQTRGWNNTGGALTGGWDNVGGVAASGGWDNNPAASGDWNTASGGLACGDENQDPNGAHATTVDHSTKWEESTANGWTASHFESSTGGDWADEMNEPVPQAAQTAPQIQW